MAQQVQGLAFDPALPSLMMLSFASNTIQVFDVERQSYLSWLGNSESSYRQRYKQLSDTLLGISFRPIGSGSAEHYAVVWSSSSLCKITASYNCDGRTKKCRGAEEGILVDSEGKVYDESTLPRLYKFANMIRDGADEKRESEINPIYAEDKKGVPESKTITRYRSILFVDFLASDEMIVVERPFNDFLSTLPPAYFQPKYGSG